jgi:hypothetical protein
MTQRNDIERVLDLWLGDGPTHVPDRLFDEAVAAVYRAPQRSPWRLRWRNLNVSIRLLAASIAVLAIVGVGAGLYALRPTDNTGTTPTPTPTPTPTADASLCQTSDSACTGLLAAGPHRTSQLLVPTRFTVPEGWRKDLDVEGALNLFWTEDADSFIAVWPDWQIASQGNCTSSPEPGLGRRAVDLVSFLTEHPGLITSSPEAVTLGGLRGFMLDARKNPDWNDGPCPNKVSMFTHVGTINDIGWITMPDVRQARYWFLEAGDGHVVNVAIDAANPAMADAFVAAATPIVESMQFIGQAGCVDGSRCLGVLAPGTYTTREMEVPLTFTVPDGWVNDWDVPLGYAIVPADAAETSEPGIFIFLDVYASTQTACSRLPAPGVGRAAADLVAWLASLPDLSITPPEAVTVGGLSGTRVDVSVTSGGPVCSPGDYQLWVSDYGPLWWGLTPGHPQRHYVLDLPSRHNVLVVLPAPEADFDALMEAVAPIVESFDFAP